MVSFLWGDETQEFACAGFQGCSETQVWEMHSEMRESQRWVLRPAMRLGPKMSLSLARPGTTENHRRAEKEVGAGRLA